MPTYVYKCGGCDNTVVMEHSMSDDPMVICDVCGAPRYRVPQRTTARFKGGGFYVSSHTGGRGPGS